MSRYTQISEMQSGKDSNTNDPVTVAELFPVADADEVMTGVDVNVTPYIEGIRHPLASLLKYTYHSSTNLLCRSDSFRKITALAIGKDALRNAIDEFGIFTSASCIRCSTSAQVGVG